MSKDKNLISINYLSAAPIGLDKFYTNQLGMAFLQLFIFFGIGGFLVWQLSKDSYEGWNPKWTLVFTVLLFLYAIYILLQWSALLYTWWNLPTDIEKGDVIKKNKWFEFFYKVDGELIYNPYDITYVISIIFASIVVLAALFWFLWTFLIVEGYPRSMTSWNKAQKELLNQKRRSDFLNKLKEEELDTKIFKELENRNDSLIDDDLFDDDLF